MRHLEREGFRDRVFEPPFPSERADPEIPGRLRFLLRNRTPGQSRSLQQPGSETFEIARSLLRMELPGERRQRTSLDSLAQTAHQLLIIMQVVHGQQNRAEHLSGLE